MPRLAQAVWVLSVFSWAQGLQVPIQLNRGSGQGDWDLDTPASENSTDHLVFDTVNSLLQHWPNTRYRNGHNLVPGIVPFGTLLYHGTRSSDVPAVPEWLATDPEHSYMFCMGSPDAGCWHHTYVATRPLNVLYFDGSSAAKMEGGSMDTQDLVWLGEVRPDQTGQERKRINGLCDWGKKFGLDGFVRMEMDFEIMYCDFKDGLQPVSKLKLATSRPVRGPPPPDTPPMDFFTNAPTNSARFDVAVLEAGSWHNHYPGDPRIQLDLSRLISFYDTDLVPSLIASRFNQTRFAHRLLNISSYDAQEVTKVLKGSLKPIHNSGIDWKGLFRVITLRYADRLEMLQHYLNTTEAEVASRTPLQTATLLVQEIRVILTPYLLHSVAPQPSKEPDDKSWAEPVFRYCATTHTEFIASTSTTTLLTPSERLLLKAVRGTTREICRVIVKVWAEAVAEGLDPFLRPSEAPEIMISDDERLPAILQGWRADINSLISWLDWSIWIKCRPACGIEEMCYLPTWPFFHDWPPKAPEEGRLEDYPAFPGPPDGGKRRGPHGPVVDQDDLFPAPRCIPLVAPFEGK
ncbi:hypothetical protein H0H92_007249 [Tricholoma furcatifolium]|nr:hypothetical protein H0H92_007249 [Tricholoma furcatifolium]